MALLKEDGSLDVERINALSIEEYMDEVGGLNEEQYEEYLSKIAINESKTPVRPAMSKSLHDAIKSGWAVSADELINYNG